MRRQIPRANRSAFANVVMPLSEVVVGQDSRRLYVGDGVTPGGIALSPALGVELQEFGGAGDYIIGGAGTDNGAAFAAAMAIGPIILPPGLYYVGSNLTVSAHVTFVPGARLIIPNGVTVTFSAEISAAPTLQIFNLTGTGAVAGLSDVQVCWFCGDAWSNPARTDGRALAQKAYDACAQPSAGSAVVRWPGGYLKHDGTPITVTKGQKTVGAGKSGTLLLWTTTATAGFAISVASYASIKGIGCSWGDYAIIPASGKFISVSGVLGVEIDDIRSDVSFDAISFTGGAASCTVENFNLYESFNSGVYCNGVGDIFVNDFIINTNFVYLTVSAISGVFAPGEQVHGGTSGAQGPLERINSGVLTIGYSAAAAPAYTVAETITGLTSGATATVTVARTPHALGGIRLQEHVEAFIAQAGDIIGGQSPMTTDATSNTQGNRPAYCSFTGVYFDSGLFGDGHNNSVEFDFNDCWWSNRLYGASFTNCDGFKFNGGKIINNGTAGHTVNATCTNFAYNGLSIRGNSASAPSTFSGILFKAGVSKFSVTNCIGDDAVLGFGTQKYAVEVEAGASDRYRISHNRFTSAQVSDGGTGVNKIVGSNY